MDEREFTLSETLRTERAATNAVVKTCAGRDKNLMEQLTMYKTILRTPRLYHQLKTELQRGR
jgi:hypothetical protein